MQRLKNEFDIELQWIPYEIHPHTSFQGELLSEKFGNTENMFRMLNMKGKEYNISFGNLTILANSNRALKAGEYAKTKNKYEDFSSLVFKSYFCENKNIGDASIINEAAATLGLDVKEMNKLIDEGAFDEIIEYSKALAIKYDINSVPTFIINDKYKIVGAQPYEDIKEFLQGLTE